MEINCSNSCMIIIALIITYADIISIYGSDVYMLQDPENNYKGGTYDYLNFLFEIRTSELNIIQGTECSGHCSTYQNNFQYSNHDYLNQYVAYCHGRLRNCTLYKNANSDSSGALKFINDMNFLFSTDYAAYFKREARLRQSTCPTCKCCCDNSKTPKQISSFCLDTISSNVAHGYVVTGVRLKIINQTVMIQIQQGKLLDTDSIDLGSVLKWQERDKCKVVEMMNYDNRSLQMDDIELSDNSIVTGVAFRKDNITGRIYLSIYGKSTNDILGNVNGSYIGREIRRISGNRTDLINDGMDLSTVCDAKSEKFSNPDRNYITFRPRKLKTDEDLIDEQVMPFLDIRDVVVNSPLKGLGLYWRGNKNCAGYVALKLFR